MSIEHVRAAFDRWHAAATAGSDLLTAVHSASSSDCVIHMQNGEDTNRDGTEAQTTQARALMPDLSLEIEDLVLTDDRMLVQVAMSGSPSLVFRIARGRRVFHAQGAVVARVNDSSEIVEIWAYINPGATLTFPPRSGRPAPALPETPPGTEADANAVGLDWQRAVTGTEFLERILATAAPGCRVHGTNADIGGVEVLEYHFWIVQSAFPDLTVSFEAGYVVGDRLVAQFQFDGTQRSWLGIAPPSGSRVQSRGSIVARVGVDRRVTEMWVYFAPGMGLIFPRRDR